VPHRLRLVLVALGALALTACHLDVTVDAYVRELCSSAPGAVTAAKRLIAQVAGQRPGEVASLTTGTIADRRVSREGQDGMQAFLEKRPAPWVPPE